MPDTLTPEQRHRCMAAVKGANTKPELIVRSLVHCLGYRFRLHQRNLPGCPDLVFPSRGKIIFVHGCFWHQHSRCRRAVRPVTHADFWNAKLQGNRDRDRRVRRALHRMSWEILIVWECQTQHPDTLAPKLARFLDDPAGI